MRVSVSIGNIGQAIKEVEKFKQRLLEKEKTFLEKLAMLGAEEAEVRFRPKENGGFAEYDGTNDVVVDTPEWISDNTICVRASGSAILFIEFGTGVYNNSPRDYPIPVPQGVLGIGEYGQRRGRHEWWLYKGEKGTNGVDSTTVDGMVFTRGNPANRCMYEADKKIRNEILNIAKEVFGDD